MPRNLLITFFTILITLGCAQDLHSAELNKTQSHNAQQKLPDLSGLSEDTLFMASVLALQNSDTESAKAYLEELYKTTNKELYLYQLTQLLAQTGDVSEAIKLLEEKSKQNPNNIELKRAMITLLLANGDLQKAKDLALALAQITKSSHDYDLSATISIYLHDYQTAVKELKIAYSLSPDETILDKMASLLFIQMDKKDEAIALYETHSRLYGYSKFICKRMVLAYEQVGRYDDAIEIYKILYSKFGDQDALSRIIEIYLSNYKINDLIAFLQKTKADDAILLEAYKYKKDFVMASRTAMKIYKKTKDPKFLGQSAIYKFEANSHKSHVLIKETIENLTIALKNSSDDIFENYLGYLLIDYNIDVGKGIDYVKKALTKDPKSPFYLDSLAWGQYKQKKCKEAFETIKLALDGAKDDPTVKEHYDLIKKCAEKSK